MGLIVLATLLFPLFCTYAGAQSKRRVSPFFNDPSERINQDSDFQKVCDLEELPTADIGSVDEVVTAFKCKAGQYLPPTSCSFENLVLDTRETGKGQPVKLIAYTGENEEITLPEDENDGMASFRLWNVTLSEGYGQCDATVDVPVLFFGVPYGDQYDGKMNYYHYTIDYLIPMHYWWTNFMKKMESSKNSQQLRPGRILVPTVTELTWPLSSKNADDAGLVGYAWNTTAFDDPSKFWMESLQVLNSHFGELSHVIPLSYSAGMGQVAEKDRGTFCLRHATLGLPNYDRARPQLLMDFFAAVRWGAGVGHRKFVSGCAGAFTKKIGLVTRTNRRLIVNENELLEAIKTKFSPKRAVMERISFGNGFVEDIKLVQEYDILVGMQGSGMTNAFYMAPGAVAIVMYQYGAPFDVFQGYLPYRGKYISWTNPYEEHSYCDEITDPHCDSPDTYVKVDDFLELVAEAISAVNFACKKFAENIEKQFARNM